MYDKLIVWILFTILLIGLLIGSELRILAVESPTILSSKLVAAQVDKVIKDVQAGLPLKEEAQDLTEEWAAPPPDIILDRERPLYRIYKNGIEIEVDTDLQWYIRDICVKYNFYEQYVYGMILCESTFHPNAKNGNCYGLCQINTFWITRANMKHFTTNYNTRKLTDPYDNLLTLSEMWTYAADAYNLDLTLKSDMAKVCYWHNTGRDPRNITTCKYFQTIEGFANELISLQ